MTDKKSLAIILGTTIGIAAVAVTAAVYMYRRHGEPECRDVNDVVEQAKQTVRKLDEALDLLRQSAA